MDGIGLVFIFAEIVRNIKYKSIGGTKNHASVQRIRLNVSNLCLSVQFSRNGMVRPCPST
jgi:hypothetical protein